MTLETEGKTHPENVTQQLPSFGGTLRDTPKTAAKDTKKSGDPLQPLFLSSQGEDRSIKILNAKNTKRAKLFLLHRVN